MNHWPFTASRWPERASSIRRRMKDDEAFREVVADYEIARTALQHWGLNDPPETPRVIDYTRLVRELEDEIEANLSLP